ncbi:MAG: helix-turn-helix transcriptional regulator [Clostridia bacterium]|nr:helix-turn-helix transcriptional regulator [Clostridia bacterium]
MDNMIKKLRDLREDNDLSQQTVAEYLGTSQTMYARYERQANELPVRHLKKLCVLYNVSADYLLGVKNDEKRKFGKIK